MRDIFSILMVKDALVRVFVSCCTCTFCCIYYVYQAYNYNLVDMNECTSGHGCSHICENTDGSYFCSCPEGYSLNNDDRTCFPLCGGNLTATIGSFHTPNWPHSYPSLEFRCEWVIDINVTDAVIEIIFNEPFGIRGRAPCPTDYVEVFEHDSTSLGKYCFLSVPNPITTTQSTATVVFQASSFPHSLNRVGVSVSYSTLYLGKLL